MIIILHNSLFCPKKRHGQKNIATFAVFQLTISRHKIDERSRRNSLVSCITSIVDSLPLVGHMISLSCYTLIFLPRFAIQQLLKKQFVRNIFQTPFIKFNNFCSLHLKLRLLVILWHYNFNNINIQPNRYFYWRL